MTLLGLALAILAFALLGLAGEHRRRRLGRPPGARRAWRMRVAAWVALAAAFPPAILAQGWVFGPIQWAGSIMFAAGIVFLALNFLPDRNAR